MSMLLKKLRGNKKGFSLVELVIVIAIMAVLIAILVPQYLKYVEKSRVSKDAAQADEIMRAVQVALSDEAAYNNFMTELGAEPSTNITWSSSKSAIVFDLDSATTFIEEVGAGLSINGKTSPLSAGTTKPGKPVASEHIDKDYTITVNKSNGVLVVTGGWPGENGTPPLEP